MTLAAVGVHKKQALIQVEHVNVWCGEYFSLHSCSGYYTHEKQKVLSIVFISFQIEYLFALCSSLEVLAMQITCQVEKKKQLRKVYKVALLNFAFSM